MKGAWREKGYVPTPPVKLETVREVARGSQLGPYLAGIVIGAVLGAAALYLVIPFLPYAR